MVPQVARHSEKFNYFYEVARNGSLQSTARLLGISAPSLSHSIKELERAFGEPLFHRNKTGVTLTRAGEKLFDFCKKYFRAMAEVQNAIARPDEKTLQRIKIGTFQSIALYFWPLILDVLGTDSKISLSIKTDRSKAITEDLIKGHLDIALTVESMQHEKIIRHELYHDEYAFFVCRSFKKNTLTKNDLKSLPVLYIPDAIDQNGKSLRQYLRSWNIIFADEFELDSFEVIVEFVKKNYGVGIIPTKVANLHRDELKQVSIEGQDINTFGLHRFFLSYRNDLDLPQSLVTYFYDMALKAVSQMNRRNTKR